MQGLASTLPQGLHRSRESAEEVVGHAIRERSSGVTVNCGLRQGWQYIYERSASSDKFTRHHHLVNEVGLRRSGDVFNGRVWGWGSTSAGRTRTISVAALGCKYAV